MFDWVAILVIGLILLGAGIVLKRHTQGAGQTIGEVCFIIGIILVIIGIVLLVFTLPSLQ